MSALFASPPDIPTPPVPPKPPTPTDEAARASMEAAAQHQMRAAARAKGRASTLLTGGEGIVEAATVKRKVLFGE